MAKFSHELNITVKPPAKRLCLASDYPSSMDIFEIRHRNLLGLIDALERRGVTLQKDQAQRLGLAPSFLSQLKGGKKMGEDVARKLEAEGKKDRGWMDQPHWDTEEKTAPPSQSQPVILDVSMIAETVKALRRNAELRHRPFTMETEEDVERFLHYYRIRQGLPDPIYLENVIEIDSVRDHAKATGALSDRREASTSTAGDHRSGRARKGAPRKG